MPTPGSVGREEGVDEHVACGGVGSGGCGGVGGGRGVAANYGRPLVVTAGVWVGV